MAGKVTTLFEDSAKTQAIFPRTKASAVSDADNHPLGNVAVYSAETVASGVDEISIGVNSGTVFTITEDDTGATLGTPITFRIVSKS